MHLAEILASTRDGSGAVTTFLGLPTAPRGVGHLRGSEPFPVAASEALADTQLRRNLGQATATIRAKRAAVVAELPDWEELRDAGPGHQGATPCATWTATWSSSKSQVQARGGTVHWARDAAEANPIVAELVRAAGANEVVKVKSHGHRRDRPERGAGGRRASPPTRPTWPS